MTTDTALVRTSPAVVPGWQIAARWLFSAQAFVGAWVFGAIAVLGVIVMAIVSQFHHPLVSAVQFGMQASMWAAFGTGIGFLYTYTTTHIAAGLTRRDLAIGGAVAALGTAALHTLVWFALFTVEGFIYRALGWTQTVYATSDYGLHVSPGPVFYLGIFLLIAAAMSAATLIAIVFYRYRTRTGIFTLPLTFAPLAVVGTLAIDPDHQWSPWSFGLSGLGQSVYLAIAAATLIVAWLVTYQVIRHMRIEQKAT